MKKSVFTIRLVYKSGYVHDFDVFAFKVESGTWKWESADDSNKPIIMGVDEIAAVWQLGHREIEVADE